MRLPGSASCRSALPRVVPLSEQMPAEFRAMFGVAACVRKTCMHLVMAATDGVKSCRSASQDLLAYYQGLPRFVFYTDTPLLLVFGGGLCAAHSTALSVVTFSLANI